MARGPRNRHSGEGHRHKAGGVPPVLHTSAKAFPAPLVRLASEKK